MALEALKGEKTLQELATIYAVHPNMIALWKKQLVERASMIFEKEGKDKEAEAAERTQDELFRQIGQLQVENEFLKKLQTAVWERTEAIEPEHPELSIGRQCELLGVSRSIFYYRPKEEKEDPDLAILTAILAVMHEKPFYGYRKIARALAAMGVTRKQVRRIMHTAGLRAIYPGKQLSKPSKGCKKYPYLLRGKTIWLPNQVWASDITYLRLSGGYVYLVTIIDLYSRKILSWSISNTMDEQFCVAALEEAIARYEVPGIFNTDQGSQFTSDAFLAILEAHGIQISMDSVNRALDTIIVERFWRSLKYEDIYIKDYRTLAELKLGVSRYIRFYNSAHCLIENLSETIPMPHHKI